MNKGDKVVCRNPNGYAFTEGKEYTVIEYSSEAYEADIGGFTWPAYVAVKDDYGREVACHASRFRTP